MLKNFCKYFKIKDNLINYWSNHSNVADEVKLF